MMLAIIGGEPSRFAPYADLYRRALTELGQPSSCRSASTPPASSRTDDREARDLLFPHFKKNRDRIGAERGWGPATREQFEAEADHGALFVGSPETVAQKIARTVSELGHRSAST